MTLSLRGDIAPNGITFRSVCASGSTLIAVTTEPRLRKYIVNNTSMQFFASSALTGGSVPGGVTFISPASVCVAFSTTARFDIYDANTLASTGITTNATTVNRTSNQQVAGIPALNLAMATSSTNGRLTLVGLTCAAAINPSVLSGQQAKCIIAKPDSNTWLVGTNNGKIVEINSGGAVLTVVHVASTPAVSAPTIAVNSLSYHNNMVLACTDTGQVATYSWPTGTLIHRLPITSSSTTNSTVLCASVSGTTLMTTQNNISTNYKGLEEVWFETGTINLDCSFFNETATGIIETGIEPGLAYAWAIFGTSSGPLVRIFNLTSTAKTLIPTRAMDPLGTDIAQRILRIRDCNGIGNAVVEVDQTVFPGTSNITATEDRNYIEISIKGNIVNGNPPYVAWDIREFQS